MNSSQTLRPLKTGSEAFKTRVFIFIGKSKQRHTKLRCASEEVESPSLDTQDFVLQNLRSPSRRPCRLQQIIIQITPCNFKLFAILK